MFFQKSTTFDGPLNKHIRFDGPKQMISEPKQELGSKSVNIFLFSRRIYSSVHVKQMLYFVLLYVYVYLTHVTSMRIGEKRDFNDTHVVVVLGMHIIIIIII